MRRQVKKAEVVHAAAARTCGKGSEMSTSEDAGPSVDRQLYEEFGQLDRHELALARAAFEIGAAASARREGALLAALDQMTGLVEYLCDWATTVSDGGVAIAGTYRRRVGEIHKAVAGRAALSESLAPPSLDVFGDAHVACYGCGRTLDPLTSWRSTKLGRAIDFHDVGCAQSFESGYAEAEAAPPQPEEVEEAHGG